MKPFISSDSFEALRAAAASGSLVAVLPNRVATRLNDLVELVPPGKIKEDGSHRIYVVSQANCEREEANFLAAESARLLS